MIKKLPWLLVGISLILYAISFYNYTKDKGGSDPTYRDAGTFHFLIASGIVVIAFLFFVGFYFKYREKQFTWGSILTGLPILATLLTQLVQLIFNL